MSNPYIVLHLSHTDVRCDARILRQVEALRRLREFDVKAIGVESDEGVVAAPNTLFVGVSALRLLTRRLTRLPRLARYFLNLMELTLRMFPRAVWSRPRIVHCHDTLVLPLGVMVSILTGCAVIYDAHELESQKSGQTKRMARGTLLIERWCWRRISLLVSVSPSILDWYRANLGPKQSLLILNSPVMQLSSEDLRRSRKRAFGAGGYFHERFEIPEGAPVFVYLGYLVSGRGIEPLLDVFRRTDILSHVVFMGSGDSVGVGRHAEEFPNIHLHAPVPHDQVVQLVREADCGLCMIEDVSLSDRLCLPNKLFEYAFAGIPILASRLPEIERVVTEYGLGLCCDNDAGSIRVAVQQIELERLPLPLADLSELSWERQARRLQEAYHDLLAEPVRRIPAVDVKD